MQGLLRWAWVALHALAVAVLILLFYWSQASGPETDANIGAGLAGLLLLGLGLPWTMLLWLIEPHEFSSGVRWLVEFGPAVVNVVIHAVLRSCILKRRARGQTVAH